jgi:biopolymer transport protein ExbD
MAVKLHHVSDELEVNHEINVTPFIDVILVLLIIFMVVAPLATVDVEVDLPASTAPRQMRPDKPIFLTITVDRGLSIGDAPVAQDGLAAALDLASGGDKEQRVFLRADKSIDYDTLMRTLNVLRAAGYLKVALMGLDQGSGP